MDADGGARARAQRLIAFAHGQDAAAVVAVEPRRRRTAVAAAVAVAVIGGSAATGYFVLGADPGDAAAPLPSTASPSTSALTAPAETTPPTTPATTTAPTTSPTTSTTPRTTTTEAPEVVHFELDLLSPVRWADIEAGVIHLRGEVPDEATVEQMRAMVSAVTTNLVVEYSVFDRVARATSEPWRVRDPDFFAPGAPPSAASTATADLLVAVMVQNPSLTVQIRAHTDSAGDPLQNQAFTQQQVEALGAYLTSRGVDPGRLELVGAGGTEPVSTDGTPEAAALNRRVEFVITGLPS